MAIILFDTDERNCLLPFSATRALGAIRLGILTQQERWEQRTRQKVHVATAPFLQCLYDSIPEGEHIWVDALAFPKDDGVRKVKELKSGEALLSGERIWAVRVAIDQKNLPQILQEKNFGNLIQASVRFLQHPWQMIEWNREQLIEDYDLVTAHRFSASIPEHVHSFQAGKIFIEAGAQLSPCWLNATDGPIYIGKNATILEGAAIRGPFAMGEGAVVKMHSSIYGATTLGPYCVGGGEIKNSLMMGYSNKAHQGYLGDAVIGEWCNIGAGATNSNVKNTAAAIHVWDFHTRQYKQVGQKCGVMMGDYCTVSIQAAMNTGSMYGTCCNIFGSGLLPTIVEPCSWGVTGTRYELPKAIAAINNWKQMKGKTFTADEISVLEYIFAQL